MRSTHKKSITNFAMRVERNFPVLGKFDNSIEKTGNMSIANTELNKILVPFNKTKLKDEV